jgi:hypothetical protein
MNSVQAQGKIPSCSNQIKDFSLIFRYNDGREKHVALTAVPGGKATSREKMLYFRRGLFGRQSK